MISESSVTSFARHFLPVVPTPCVTVGKSPTWVPVRRVRVVIRTVRLGCSHSIAEINVCEGGEHGFEMGGRRQEFTEEGQSKGMAGVTPLAK